MNGRRFLVASILSVQNSSFVYPSCLHCFSKLSLRFSRYNCLKCGFAGDTKEANYRYRLLLEVADTQDVFEVTVFGSCLDVYFGVTAKGLQRYIEELNREAGEPDGEAILGVVFQAVETCFTGKKFVFEVKDSPKPDATSFLQNGYQTDRHPKAFTACEMFLPDPGLLGCTVIYYIEQRRYSQFKHSLWPPDLFVAFDHSSREFKSLHGSGISDVVPPGPTDTFSSFWPQSFGLTWCSISSGTTEHSLALDETTCDKPECKDGFITSRSHLFYNLKDCILTVNKRNEQEDKKTHLHSSGWNITIRTELEGHSSLGGKDANALQRPLALEKGVSSNETGIHSSYGLENAQASLLRQRQEDHLASTPSSHSTADAVSPEMSGSLGELPASESITEFFARLENNNITVSPCNFPSNHIDEFSDTFNQPDLEEGTFHAGFMSRESDEKLQKLVKKVELSRDYPLTLLSSVNSKESYQEAYRPGKKQEWGRLSGQQPFILHLSFMANPNRSHSKGNCPSSKEIVVQDFNSCSSNSAASCLENPCLHIRNAIAKSNYKRPSNLCERGTKTSPSHQLNQTTDLPNIQEQGSTSGVREKSDKVDKERELFLDEQVSHLSPVCSNCPKNCFDASADLFDVSAGGSAKATLAELPSSQAASPWTGEVTPSCLPSVRMPCEADTSWNDSHYRSSLRNMLETSALRTSTPVAGSEIKLEHSLRGTPGFLLDSQSVPLDRPCHQGSLSPEEKSILSELPPNRLSWDNVKRKRARLPFRSLLVKQLVSKFPSSARSSSTNSSTVSTCGPQRLLISDILAPRLPPEGGSEVGIPSLEKMQVQDVKKKRRRKSLLRHIRDCRGLENPPLSGKMRRATAACKVSRLIKVGFTPNRQQQTAEGNGGGQPICPPRSNCGQQWTEPSGTSPSVGSSDSSRSLPLSPIANWSGELFSGGSQAPSPEAIPSKPRP